jgi:phosphate transport system substrate-binding protein
MKTFIDHKRIIMIYIQLFILILYLKLSVHLSFHYRADHQLERGGGADAPVVCITQDWGAKPAQMIEFQQNIMDDAPYREDRKEFARQPDQVAALLQEPYGIIAISPAFVRPGIKATSIDGYAPEPQHIQSGAYLLSRPLLLVSQAHPPGQVKQFIDFMLSSEGQEIVARKFVPVR